jgi:hypothetical protein
VGLEVIMRAVVHQAIDHQRVMQATNTRDTRGSQVVAVVQKIGFRMMMTTLDSPVGERARLVHILETWLRRIHVWGDGLRAADPRDLVFSLCSMTHWKEDCRVIKPDYKKSVRDGYIDVAKHFFESGWSNLLAWRNPPEADDEEVFPDIRLPTFVPDWRRPIRPVHLIKLYPLESNSELQFKAGDSLPGKANLKLMNGDPVVCLQVSAYIIDTICSVGPVMKKDKIPFPTLFVQGWINQLQQMYTQHEQASQKQSTVPMGSELPQSRSDRQSVARNLWRIPILDIEIIEGELKRASPDFEGSFNTWLTPTRAALLGSKWKCHDATPTLPPKRA